MKLHQDEFSNYANLPGVTKPYSKNHQQTTDTVEETDEYEKTIGKMPKKYRTGSCAKKYWLIFLGHEIQNISNRQTLLSCSD